MPGKRLEASGDQQLRKEHIGPTSRPTALFCSA